MRQRTTIPVQSDGSLTGSSVLPAAKSSVAVATAYATAAAASAGQQQQQLQKYRGPDCALREKPS